MKKGPILVVDDDASVLRLVAAVLRKHGYSVLTASDGQEGFELIRDAPQQFALLLTDVIMPRKDGLELIRDVRALSLDFPIIAMTGYSASDAGILDGVEVLTKPFKVDQLTTIVEKHLQDSAPFPYPGKRPDLMSILVHDVARLRKIFEQTQIEGTHHLDGRLTIQNSGQLQSESMKDYVRALRELNDFALGGVIPARFNNLEEPVNQKGGPSARAVG